MDRFRERRRQLFELQWRATRLRERPVAWSLLLVVAANVAVFWSLTAAAVDGTLSLGRVATYATAAITISMIAFGGWSWALDGAAAPVAAVLRLEERHGPRRCAGPRHPPGGRHAGAGGPLPRRHLRAIRPGAGRCSRAST